MSGRCSMQIGLKRRLRKSRRDEKGASLVEFVLILPLFALLLFGIVDFGSVFGGYISVQNEVNAAAREISLGALPAACNPPSGGQNPGLCTIEQYVSGSISGSTDPLGTTGQVKVAVVF